MVFWPASDGTELPPRGGGLSELTGLNFKEAKLLPPTQTGSFGSFSYVKPLPALVNSALGGGEGAIFPSIDFFGNHEG